MKTVLILLSTHRFSSPLLRYLSEEAKKFNWKIVVAGMFDEHVTTPIKEEDFSKAFSFITVTHFKQCDQAIRKANVIIAMIPDAMLLKVTDSCILYGKILITPSRLTRQMAARKLQAEENDALLLVECGFSPGLDHITAKKAVDNIHSKSGKICSFETYSGSIIDESCIDNPWHFKLTEPAHEVINSGKSNNRHLLHGKVRHTPYHQLFSRSKPIAIDGHEDIITVPEGDSLYYRKIYQLQAADTVVKGKLLRKGFDQTWDLMVRLGLTDHTLKIDLNGENSFHQFLDSFLPYSSESLESKLSNYGATSEDIEKLRWLGLFDPEWVVGYKDLSPAVVIQYLMENRFTLSSQDRDCLIMRHHLQYSYRNDRYNLTATFTAKGESKNESALARIIGYMTGAAAKSCLLGKIMLKGLHIPTRKEVYDPILNELDELSVAFHIEEKKIYAETISVDN